MSYITSNAKKSLSLILIAALLSASSCGGTESGKITDSSSPTDESTDTTAPAEKTYPFYDGVDLGGETFTVWNVMPDLWNMHCAIAPEEVDGETINDAIYNRNAKVEAKMNYKLKEVNGEYDKMATELDTLVMSGDSTYDAVYMPMFTSARNGGIRSSSTPHLSAARTTSRCRTRTSWAGTAYGAFCSTRI